MTESGRPAVLAPAASARDDARTVQRSPFWTGWACAFVALVPFLSLYLFHYLNQDGIPTGFLIYDMPYYCANGRAIFERGNGWAYPNPFDPDPQAPVIYFHWLMWLLGVGVVLLRLDPGLLLLGLEVVAGLVASWLTYRLVETVLAERRFRVYLYFLTMWGGGLLLLGQVAANAVARRPLEYKPMDFDMFEGWWFHSWGRNMVLPTEAVYHALVAIAWLAILLRRDWAALLAAAALASTHPFSGLQLLLILSAWYGLRLIFRPSWNACSCLAASGGMLLAFLGYYLVFLESVPQHRALRHVWTESWTLSVPVLLLAYGPVAFLAATRLVIDRRKLGTSEYFLLVAFLVSFFLANHHWLIPPFQPIHFTRGYIWMPLCLLGLPLLQRGLVFLSRRVLAVAFGYLLLTLSILAGSDNVGFLMFNITWPEHNFYLSTGQHDVLRWLRQRGWSGQLLCADPTLSYLSAAYTSVRPYFGHRYLTPDYFDREWRVGTWLVGRDPAPWLTEIDHIVIYNQPMTEWVKPADLVATGEWEIVHENSEYTVLTRWR